ncbi:MAG: metallophosphoesterase [Candidatus Thorarchaeota archaeon]|nr:metallophosphoesterase [Candidatus Thorarchaeota archaeon]
MDFLVLTDIHDEWTHFEEMFRLTSRMDGAIFLGDLMQFGEVSSESLHNFKKIRETARWMIAVPGNGPLPEVIQYLTNLGINIHGSSEQYEDIGFFGVGGVSDPVTLILELRDYFKNEQPKVIDLHPKSIETLKVFGVLIEDESFVVEDWSENEVRGLDRYHSPFEHTEDEIYQFLSMAYEPIREFPYRVLISHVPPYEFGMNSELPEGISTGSKAITRFIEEKKPSIVLSGHYHRYHEFTINDVLCIVVPAVKDGYYSILHFDSDSGRFSISTQKFA